MQNTADNPLLCADCGINMRRKRPIMEKYVEKFSKGCKIKLGIPLHFKEIGIIRQITIIHWI